MTRRRQFLEQGLAALAWSGASGVGQAAEPVDAAALRALERGLHGPLIRLDHDAYEAAYRFFYWNPTLDLRPAIIARCQHTDDVARCIEFGREQSLPVAVRGGGHSYLGWGSCDGGLVIDLSPMRDIAVDPLLRTARVGAGVLAHELVDSSSPYELAAVGGQCRSVGVAGLALGGGLGWLSGRFGAACDNLLSATVTMADGRSLEASPTQNTELFWAIRGGGGNFEVVTSLEFRLHPVGNVLAGILAYPLSDAAAMLEFYRDFMADSPDELQTTAFLRRDDEEPRLHIVVCYSGDPDQGARVLRPLRARQKPLSDTVQVTPYANTLVDTLGDPRSIRGVKGCYLEELSDGAIEAVLACFAEAPHEGAIGLDHYVHGAVCRVDYDATAFELRHPGAFHVWLNMRWYEPSETAANLHWADRTWRDLQRYSGDRIYTNSAHTEGAAAARKAYGRNHARLLAAKRLYDPDNVFKRNQNLEPNAATTAP